jgi:hypothetical protein
MRLQVVLFPHKLVEKRPAKTISTSKPWNSNQKQIASGYCLSHAEALPPCLPARFETLTSRTGHSRPTWILRVGWVSAIGITQRKPKKKVTHPSEDIIILFPTESSEALMYIVYAGPAMHRACSNTNPCPAPNRYPVLSSNVPSPQNVSKLPYICQYKSGVHHKPEFRYLGPFVDESKLASRKL